MSRKLIDRDALIASIPKTNVDIFENCRNCSTLCDWQVRELIEQAELVDAVEVKHGEWIIDGMNEYELTYGCVGYEPIYRCSKCGITTESYLRTERPIMPEDADFPNYCPNCGASMDGKEKQ